MIKGIKLLWAVSSILLLGACTPTEAVTEEEIIASSSIESSVKEASVATDNEESKETEELPLESAGSSAYSESAEPQSTVSHDGYTLIDVYGGDLSGYRTANVVVDIGFILSYLEGDEEPDGINNFSAGDFRSKEVSTLREEADMIITNPPFSLFREFLSWINPTEKQFLIIGNMNAITYKEVFPLIKENKIWLGTGMGRWISGFIVPDSYDLYGTEARVVHGARIVSTNNALWMTNIDHGKRHQPLSLMTMEDNIKFSKHENVKGKEYAHYDNYDAIEVPFTDAIPRNYQGVMGVPISFLDKYNPEQFEIIGASDNGAVDEKYKLPHFKKHNEPYVKEKKVYKRIFIKAVKK